jgi:hypothetical protein
MVTVGARTSSPRVAIRAYPAKAKNSSPADCKIPYAVASPTPAQGAAHSRVKAAMTSTVTSRQARVTVSSTRARRAVLVMPRVRTTVRAPTTASPTTCAARASPPSA